MKNGMTFPSQETWSYFRMLLYGVPGAGKTHLCGSSVQVPELNKVLLIDFDGGSKTVIGRPEFAGIKIVRISDWVMAQSIYDWLTGAIALSSPRKDYYNALQSELGPSKDYKCLIFDNLGALYEMILQYGLEHDQTKRYHELVPTQQDYNINHARIKKFFNYLATYSDNNQVSIIYTAHAEIKEGDLDSTPTIKPMLSGKLATYIPSKLSLVGYCTLDSTGGRKTLGGNTPVTLQHTVRFKRFDTKTEVQSKHPNIDSFTGKFCNMQSIYNALTTKSLSEGEGQ